MIYSQYSTKNCELQCTTYIRLLTIWVWRGILKGALQLRNKLWNIMNLYFPLRYLLKSSIPKKQASVCKGLHKVHALFSQTKVLILKKKTISKFFHGILSKLKVTTFPLQKSISLSRPSHLHCQSTSAGPSRASLLISSIHQSFFFSSFRDIFQ